MYPYPDNKLKWKDTHTVSICFVLDLPQEERRDFPLFVTQETSTDCDIAEFETVNKEVMGFEPTVISSLALAITQDISR